MSRKKRILQLLYIPLLFLVYYFSFINFNTEEVIVAVIDSGVDYNHNTLSGKIIKGVDFIDFDLDPMDEHGHGTHISGIITSKAPQAKILAIRTLDKENKGNYFSSLGILYAVTQGADIINMSFSEKPNPFTKWAIQYGKSRGVIFVASTGNDGSNHINFPANLPEVLAIGALDEENNQIFHISNIGKELDYLAPGVNIKSANINNGFIKKSGTSMSAPYVAGSIACLKTLSNTMTEAEIKQLLDQSSLFVNENTPYKYVDFTLLQKNISTIAYTE